MISELAEHEAGDWRADARRWLARFAGNRTWTEWGPTWPRMDLHQALSLSAERLEQSASTASQELSGLLAADAVVPRLHEVRDRAEVLRLACHRAAVILERDRRTDSCPVSPQLVRAAAQSVVDVCAAIAIELGEPLRSDASATA